MARAVILILVLFLSACSTLGGDSKPVVYCPAPPMIERPDLDIQRLKEGDTPDVVIGAYRSSIRQCQKYSIELETILRGYQQ